MVNGISVVMYIRLVIVLIRLVIKHIKLAVKLNRNKSFDTIKINPVIEITGFIFYMCLIRINSTYLFFNQSFYLFFNQSFILKFFPLGIIQKIISVIGSM